MLLLTMLFLLALAGLTKWWTKRNDKKIPKAISIPFLIISVLLIIIGSYADSAGFASNLDAEREMNEQITEENIQLAEKNEELEEKINELTEDVQTLTVEISTLTEENEEIKKDKKELIAEQETLEKENEALTNENVTLKKRAEAKKESNTTTASTTNNKSTSTDKQEPKTASTTSNNNTSTSSSGYCDIKGSNSGIYHTPGSTYYNQTKNVAQWFCSTAEAEAAGYRAPKR